MDLITDAFYIKNVEKKWQDFWVKEGVYKFGQYVIYAVTLYSIASILVGVITLLISDERFNKFQENIANIPIAYLSNAFYFSVAIILVHIVINIMIFYYTYKHRDYFVH